MIALISALPLVHRDNKSLPIGQLEGCGLSGQKLDNHGVYETSVLIGCSEAKTNLLSPVQGDSGGPLRYRGSQQVKESSVHFS